MKIKLIKSLRKLLDSQKQKTNRIKKQAAKVLVEVAVKMKMMRNRIKDCL